MWSRSRAFAVVAVAAIAGLSLAGCGFQPLYGSNTTTDLVTGYQPVLMQRNTIDGNSTLAPYNLISSWFWIYDDTNGNPRPVRQSDLEAAYLSGGQYAPEIVAAFDANADRLGL